ncbi:hypothetical protein EYF80_023692 [Liparis tanakae]|uniref:Uncharacterized protein n=1 Tax=Liparis tanakae TaxID=230148 RepID=A0A4Z2HM89_9TELE|nr:hypothetical protein EYF80_023692 [Liparis tanakae]
MGLLAECREEHRPNKAADVAAAGIHTQARVGRVRRVRFWLHLCAGFLSLSPNSCWRKSKH